MGTKTAENPTDCASNPLQTFTNSGRREKNNEKYPKTGTETVEPDSEKYHKNKPEARI